MEHSIRKPYIVNRIIGATKKEKIKQLFRIWFVRYILLLDVIILPPPNQVSWKYYEWRLSKEDLANIVTLCKRVQSLANVTEQPIAVMAVGSVFYKERGAYGDVDIVILPVDRADNSTEELLSRFIVKQPEIVLDRKKRVHESTWPKSCPTPICRHWHLWFNLGKLVNVFIYTGARHQTLQEKLIKEAITNALEPYIIDMLDIEIREFAYKIFYPTEKVEPSQQE